MRTILLLLVTASVGASAGVGLAVWRFGTLPEAQKLPPLVPEVAGPEAADPAGLAPKLSIEQTVYDFGVMDLDAEKSHDFLFTNQGEGPLRLTAGDTSCRCTLSHVDAEEIPPGGSGHVTLTWHGNEVLGSYRQTAVIHTNDPGRPRVELVIIGQITAAARAVPGELVLSQVSAGEPATAEVALYGYLDEPLEVTGFALERDDTAEYFQVAFEPLPAERMQQQPEAKSGTLVRVTVKPGLPLGAFRQTIQLSTNLADASVVEVPVKGTVTSDIMVVGPHWDSERDLLDFGTVASVEGAERRLLLIARGPHREQVSFSTLEVYPDLIQVELGKAKPINDGLVFQTPLTIRVPRGSPLSNHLGTEEGKLGWILLETGHPEAKQLRIRIRFAVKG